MGKNTINKELDTLNNLLKTAIPDYGLSFSDTLDLIAKNSNSNPQHILQKLIDDGFLSPPQGGLIFITPQNRLATIDSYSKRFGASRFEKRLKIIGIIIAILSCIFGLLKLLLK